MKSHIFKYEVPITDKIICMELPENSVILDVNHQGDKIFMWCAIDIHSNMIKRHFKIIGTGHKIIDIEKLLFVKTVHMPNGLVWHLFELQD